MFFKKSEKKKEPGKNPIGIITRVAGWLHNKILVAADSLNTKINRFSPSKLKWGVIVFCCLFGFLSSHTIYQAFKKRKEDKITIQPIRLPASVEKKLVEQDKMIIQREYQRIKLFQNYMQALAKTNPRKTDSLLQLRPGLMDSVRTILSLYETQLNN